MHGTALIWSEMQRKCVAVVYSVHLFWLGVSLYFSSQKSQCKAGSSTSEVF